MKKTIIMLLTVILVVSAATMLIACNDDKDPVIEKYNKIEDDSYSVGDKYNSADAGVEAVLTDGTTVKITKNLVFVGEDNLELDVDKQFTKKGTFTIKVYNLEERKDLYIGEWKITVA